MAKSKKSTSKSTKSNNKKKNEVNNVSKRVENDITSDSLKGKMIAVCGIVAFICLFYLLAIHITNKNSNTSNDSSKDKVTDYSEIIAGNSFNRDETEYIVVYYDKGNDDIKSTIDGYVTGYTVKDNSLTTYTVDMSNMFNVNYVTSDETNKNPNNIDELKINGPTLIKFHKGSVMDYVEGTDSIKEYLEG